jgi:transposase
MPLPHGIDLRERAVGAYLAGEGSLTAIALRFEIPRSALEEWVKLKRTTGSVSARDRGGGNPSNIDVAILHEVVAARPDGTTHEVAAEYNRRVRRSERVHRSSIYRALQRAGYVFKKNGFVLENRTAPTSK